MKFGSHGLSVHAGRAERPGAITRFSASSGMAGTISVAMNPGATELTVIPLRAVFQRCCQRAMATLRALVSAARAKVS